MVKAIRSGKPLEISVSDVVAGDVLRLEPGDLVPADGILVSGHALRADESLITGETDQVRKLPGEKVMARMRGGQDVVDRPDDDPFIVSGSKILEGVGTYLEVGRGTQQHLRPPAHRRLGAVARSHAAAATPQRRGRRHRLRRPGRRLAAVSRPRRQVRRPPGRHRPPGLAARSRADPGLSAHLHHVGRRRLC